MGWQPEADAGQAAANLRDLQESSGGFARIVDQKQDLDNALESLGQAVADLQRVHFTPPWTWRMLGGSHHLTIRLSTADGQQLPADMGAVSVGAERPWWILIVLGGVALAALIVIVLLRRPRAAPQPDEPEFDEEALMEAHDLIRRGASPKRAVEELLRDHPESVRALIDLPPSVFTDPRYPYFRTRLGKLRLQEIAELVAKRSADQAELGDRLAQILADAIGSNVPPDKAAESISGRVGADECAAFVALDFDQLADAMNAASRDYGILGTPRARGAAVDIQEALKTGSGSRGIVVGWLVRTGGPGTRGETLRVGGEGTTLVGQSPGCGIRILGDPGVAAEHAEIALLRGEFTLTGREGAVTVEGTRINDRHTLSDGETIGIGNGLFVFKSASAGNLSRLLTAPPRNAVTRR